MNYQSSTHNGSYIANPLDFFEWWYFDFDLKNHYSVYLEWHNPLFCLKDFYNTLIFGIYNPNNKVVNNNVALEKTNAIKTFRYPRTTVFQSLNKCNISFPSGYIKEVGGNYIINIFEKNLQINLKLERILPSISIKDNLIYQLKNRKEHFYWCIPLPRALVKGKIEINGKLIEVEGVSYHDHNWGNLNLKRYLKGWIWVRIFFKNYTLIFADVVAATPGPREKIQVFLFLDKNGQRVDTTSFQVNYRSFDNQGKYKINIPRYFSIESDDKRNYRIDIRITRKFFIKEFPFVSVENNFLNELFIRFNHLFRFYYAPSLLKKLFGRFTVFRSEVISELYKDDRTMDKQIGKMEVISFES